MSNFQQANKKIETAVVGGYKKIENGVVSGYRRIEDKFVETFLTEEGETIQEAKARLAGESEQRKQALKK